MKKIGLTGGIGSGKSYISEIFKKLDIPVFNADENAKIIVNSNKEVIKKIKLLFGNKIYCNDIIDSKKLADIVFSDKNKLMKLNKIIHPNVINLFKNWSVNQKKRFIIKESAIIFESKTNIDLDYVIAVSAPVNLRIKRVLNRDKIKREDVLKRINNQLDEKKLIELSDFIIVNDGIELLLPQITAIIEKISLTK